MLLPTHPLRLAWVAAHDQLLRGWAEEVAQAGKTRPARASRIDIDMVSRLSPANLPFITVDPDGKPFVYAEELTYGAALYLPPTTDEPQSAADVICGPSTCPATAWTSPSPPTRSATGSAATANAHPGTGDAADHGGQPGLWRAAAHGARRRWSCPAAASDDDPLPADPQRAGDHRLQRPALLHRPGRRPAPLQRSVSSAEMRHAATHLAPPLGLAARDLARLTRGPRGAPPRGSAGPGPRRRHRPGGQRGGRPAKHRLPRPAHHADRPSPPTTARAPGR